MRVLLAEDDPMIGETVRLALRDAAYAVDWVQDGQSALTALGSQAYDLLLLDLGLPGKDGVDVLRLLRTHNSSIPVIIMTARDALDDRVLGLDGGADDYLAKPFAMVELLARMRAVIRRRAGTAGPALSNGMLTLDLRTRVAVIGSTSVALSGREFALLQALLIRPGAILSRAQLEDRLYGWNEEVESNAIDFIIHSLRKKLGSDAIRNVRGVGWMVSRGH